MPAGDDERPTGAARQIVLNTGERLWSVIVIQNEEPLVV